MLGFVEVESDGTAMLVNVDTVAAIVKMANGEAVAITIAGAQIVLPKSYAVIRGEIVIEDGELGGTATPTP